MCVFNETAVIEQLEEFYQEVLHPLHHIILHAQTMINSFFLYLIYTRIRTVE